jgi:cold shock CspA family protein
MALMPFRGICVRLGRYYFFRRESMASDKQWTALVEGTDVRFCEHEGDKGPHASAVAVI